MCSTKKVKKIIKQLQTNLDLYEIPEYKVTEISTRHGEHTYIVHKLEAEYEDGGVYFGDLEKKILTNQYALMGFLISSVKDVIIENKIIEIFFDSNSILIELVG